MRIVRILLSFSVTMSIIGVIVFFIGREALLYIATVQVESDIKQMEKISFRDSEYSAQCRQKGGAGAGRSIRSIQLRFVDSDHYVLEVVCEYFSQDPITLKRATLPWSVKKVAGESGMIWDPGGRSGIDLSIFGRVRTIILDGSDVIVSLDKVEIEGNKPISVCAGYGYQCCDAITQTGDGAALSTGVTDCPQLCFSQCLARPVVLRFSADPAPDLKTKVVNVKRGEQVSLFYVIDVAGIKDVMTSIEFGDGQVYSSEQSEGLVTHDYNCLDVRCSYIATVQAKTAEGNASAITAVTTLEVVVGD